MGRIPAEPGEARRVGFTLTVRAAGILRARRSTARRAAGPRASRPAGADRGERYFHITDPDGHELSFARKLSQDPSGP